jgi:ABC-type multidrug transport system fused ATPase/permease subunit
LAQVQQRGSAVTREQITSPESSSPARISLTDDCLVIRVIPDCILLTEHGSDLGFSLEVMVFREQEHAVEDDLMTLWKRVLVNVSATIVVLIAILFVISRFVIVTSFAELESENIQQNVRRVTNDLNENISPLDVTNSHWAASDDFYAFVEYGNQEFIESNLLDIAFDSTGLRLNVMLYL